MKSYFILVLLFSIPAFAVQSDWTLNSKLAGPEQGWVCPVTAKIFTEKGQVEFQWPPMSSIFMSNINDETECRDLNSSYIFGGVRCYQAVLSVVDDLAIYEKYECSKEGFFAKFCDPLKEGVSESLQFNGTKTLVVTRRIGWENDPIFSCEYETK